MCGIAGFVGRGDENILHRMSERLSHRGPDASGIWHDPKVGVGFTHTRLSIIDLVDGAQPMWTIDRKLGIVFNGEIYNAVELREELVNKGCKFTTHHSDTEVLLHGYKIWGSNFVSKLNGMWAFVIVDFDNSQIFASRDRFGKKPFYYHYNGGDFVFASELPALQEHPLFDSEPNTLAIKKYFAYGYIPAPLTQYKAVQKLPAGCNLEYSLAKRSLKIQRYWRFTLEPGNDDRGEDYSEQLIQVLQSAVDCRLNADVPVGTFLSGGIDSTIISAMAAQNIGAKRLKTFSIGFEEASFDESGYARIAANHIGTEHFDEILGVDTLLSFVNEVRDGVGEPLADSSILPTWLVSKMAKEQVTVALGGDGADELFAGYSPFQALKWASILDSIFPGKMIEIASSMSGLIPVSHNYMSLDFKVKRALGGLLKPKKYWVPSWMAPVDPLDVNRLVCDGTVHSVDEIYSEVATSWNECEQDDLVSKILQFFTDIYMQDDILTKIDRASMMNSLEVRSPFLDINVVNFVRTLPVTQKLQGGKTKWLLKQAASHYLPKTIIHRKKQGFAMPVGRWFREKTLSISPERFPDYLDPLEVSKRADRHISGASDERLFLWATLMLER